MRGGTRIEVDADVQMLGSKWMLGFDMNGLESLHRA